MADNKGKSKLFDDSDDDDQGYQPQTFDNDTQAQTNTENQSTTQQQTFDNQESQQESQQDNFNNQNNNDNAGDDYQYQPQQNYDNQDNNQIDTGYTDQRQELMNEQPIVISDNAKSDFNQENQQPTQDYAEANEQLKQETEDAKGKLYDEIEKFNKIDHAELPEDQEEDPRSKKFSVKDPKKQGSHYVYSVTGIDEDGEFTCTRRFNEFFTLRSVLHQRWPGIYIPAIPEKKTWGNKEDDFIDERRNLLERFMKELAKFDYLIYSKEFKIFTRQQGEITKVLTTLTKQTPSQILEKYKLNFKVNEETDEKTLHQYREKINQMQGYLKKAIALLEVQKTQLKELVNTRNNTFIHTRGMITYFMRYEDNNLEYYTDADVSKRIFTHPESGDMKQRMEAYKSEWKNPYKDTYIWLKGELLDARGMADALVGRELCMKQQIAAENQRKADQSEIEKISQGKTSLKNFWKSKSSKESDSLNLQARVESTNTEIEDYKKLIHFLTIYHGEVAIEKFKREKSTNYLKALSVFCVREVQYAHHQATTYHQLLNLGEKQN